MPSKNRVTVNLPGEDSVQLKGRFNRNHDEVKIRAVSRSSEGRVVTNVVLKFNSNSNPTSFTATVNSTNGTNATAVGTKVV